MYDPKEGQFSGGETTLTGSFIALVLNNEIVGTINKGLIMVKA